MMQNLIESTSEGKMGEIGRKIIYRMIESATKEGKMSEIRRKMIYRLIEVDSKSEMSERGREMIHR